MNDFIRVLIVLLVTGLTLPALLVTVGYLLPGRVVRVQNILNERPRRAFLVGGINALFFGLLMAIFANGGDAGGLIALLLLLFVTAMAFVGVTAVLLTLRQRMFGQEDVRATGKTAVLLTAALLTPLVGWFILTPILLITGLGGTIMSLVRRRQKTPETVSYTPPEG